MRRAGYEVWLSYDLKEALKKLPQPFGGIIETSLVPGNLQHLRLFLLKGIIPAHRFLF